MRNEKKRIDHLPTEIQARPINQKGIHDKVRHWCSILKIAEMPNFLVQERSYYWNKMCIFDARSKNIDHDIVHELVHFKDDLKFNLELLNEFASILKIGAVIGAAVVSLLNVPLGAFIVILCAAMKAVKELFTEGRAEYYAIHLAGGVGRMTPFLSLLFFNSAILSSCVLLSLFVFLIGAGSRMAVVIITCAVISLAILSLVSEKILW